MSQNKEAKRTVSPKLERGLARSFKKPGQVYFRLVFRTIKKSLSDVEHLKSQKPFSFLYISR